jgi:subtilisin family serine protease
MQHKRNEKLRINIILNEQYNQAEMQNKTQFIKNNEEKRSFVVNELKEFSKVTQRNIIMLLSEKELKSAISDIQSSWIVNMITCYASIETIEELSLHPDVLIIGWDNEQFMLPEEKSQAIAESTTEITYNITKVQANEVWALGYLGQYVVVAIIDTGVNYNHNDLAGNLWTHPNYPYHGWNFVSNNNNPIDDHGHGTHCAGTVAGQGASGSHTGIAPSAKIMAVKVWNAYGSGSTSQMCAGIQFAADNGANVISMSGGVRSGGTEAERIQFRNTMTNVLNMGIIASIAAGNEGPGSFWPVDPPNSIRVPGNCPPPWLHPDQTLQGGLTAVISVGATDQNDDIASFSSRGPVTWQSITGFNDYAYNPGMGLIRPDMVAPGVDIKSLSYTDNSGYVYMSGTSMATPCVAGVIALMLSKQSYLSPAQISEILETTTLPLSITKSNIYGSGRINALEAVQAVPCLTINFTNQTVTSNTTITSCSGIYVQNVSVENGAKLTLDAATETTINGDFEVTLGSELEVK